MTPNIDERREVAERLREIPSKGFGLVMLCDAVNAEHEGETYSAFVHGFVNRLADLIEPLPDRTCRNVGGEDGTNGEYYDFACDACGFCCDLPEPSFCPGCGAKVVEP